MGVFKEEAHMFEIVARKQTRIYNDAADFGYPYNTSKIPEDVKNLIDAVNRFKESDKRYSNEAKFIRNRVEYFNGVSLDVIIFWEEDEGYYFGTKYSISFNKTPKHASLINKECNAFISVDINSYREKI
jgi:hypothetical protein